MVVVPYLALVCIICPLPRTLCGAAGAGSPGGGGRGHRGAVHAQDAAVHDTVLHAARARPPRQPWPHLQSAAHAAGAVRSHAHLRAPRWPLCIRLNAVACALVLLHWLQWLLSRSLSCGLLIPSETCRWSVLGSQRARATFCWRPWTLHGPPSQIPYQSAPQRPR